MQKIRSHEWDFGIQGCRINGGRINEGRLYNENYLSNTLSKNYVSLEFEPIFGIIEFLNYSKYDV